MSTFALPDLGEGLRDAEIVAWHVCVGDRVVADQPLVSVETDKAVIEIPAPEAGKITALHAAEGDTIPTGDPLVDIAGEADECGAEDEGAIVGTLPRDRPAVAPQASRSPHPPPRVRIAPAVRKFAADRGISLDGIAGTGPDGTVTRSDVEAAAALPEGWDALRGVRRAMARTMSRANAEVAVTTVSDDADVSDWPVDADVTLRLIAALVDGCRAAPALNAWYDGAREALRLHDRIDLGIAVDTGDGLFAPVLRAAGQRDAADLRRGIDAMKRDIQTRAIPRDQLRDATITLSNFGTICGRYAALAVVPPQVAILGAGRIRPTPRVVEGLIVVGHTLPLSLSFDHRVVTGAEASRFLSAAIATLERPDA